jgi:PAS domain S-box-containing protein
MAATPELHSVFDAEHRLSYANAAFLNLWGILLEEAHGMTLRELGYEPWQAEMHGCEIDQVVRTKEPVSGEMAFSGRRLAQTTVYEYRLVPVITPEGEVDAVCMTMRDITERRRAGERALRVARLGEQLAQLKSEEEIIRHAVETVGQLIGAHRCYFVECLDGGSRMAVSENWVRDKAPSLAGTLSLFEAGGADWCSWYFAGKAAVDDVRRHPGMQHRASRFEAIQVTSYLVQPVKRDGQQGVVLVATENVARPWTAEDVMLLEAVGACVWPHVEQLRTRVRLEDAENRLRLVSDHIPGLIKYIGRDLCVHRNERALGPIHGHAQSAPTGTSLRALLGEESYQERLPFLQRALAGESVRFQGSSEHPVEGRQAFDVTYVPDCDGAGDVRGLYALEFDVTEHLRTCDALANQSERLRLLWACARVLLTTDDPDTMLHRLFSEIGGNLGADAFFNFVVESPEKTLRLRSWRGISDAQADVLSQIGFNDGACGEVARTRRPVIRSVAADGLGLCAYAGYPLIADGQLLGTLGFASRTKEAFSPAELEFIEILSHYVTAAYVRLELMASLREADRRKDEFLATLAHELRNPLAPICTSVEVLRHLTNTPEQTAEIIGIIERQALQMVRLIDDLVDVSRITRGKLQLNRASVDLDAILTSALETAKPVIDRGGHQLITPRNLPAIRLHADAGRLSQVFSNLLNNAARYTPDGGRIELVVESSKESVTVTIRDNGDGIDPAMQERIFEMFTQLSRSGKSATEGLGIGLGLVRQLVEMHQGSIEVYSAGLGQGSEFRVSLPLDRAATGAADTPALAITLATPKITKVLVVDDGVSAADMLAMFLQLEGFETRTAYDGMEALAVAAEMRPQVAFLDLGMPRLNGFDTARRIRQLPGCHDIILIALTGWGQDADRRKTQQAGFDYHLVKPIEPRLVREMLATLSLERKPSPLLHPEGAAQA